MKCKECNGKLKFIRSVSVTTSYEIDDNFNLIPYDNLDSSEDTFFQCKECGKVYKIKEYNNCYVIFNEVGKLFLQSYSNTSCTNLGTELKENDIELEE